MSSNYRTVLWQIGRLISDAIDAAHTEAAQLTPTDDDRRKLDERIAAAADAAASVAKRRRVSVFIRTLIAIGLSVWISLSDLPSYVKPVAVLGVLLLWFLVAVVAWWRRLHRRIRRRRRHHRDRPGDDMQQAIEEFLHRSLSAAARRSDAERLQARYDEYRDWAEIAAQLLHRPWLPRSLRYGDPGQQLSPPDPDTLPRACSLAYAHFATDQLARVSAAAVAATFSAGWLSEVIDDAITEASREWLGLHPAGRRTTASDGTDQPPDPYSEQNRDPENIRAGVVQSRSHRRPPNRRRQCPAKRLPRTGKLSSSHRHPPPPDARRKRNRPPTAPAGTGIIRPPSGGPRRPR